MCGAAPSTPSCSSTARSWASSPGGSAPTGSPSRGRTRAYAYSWGRQNWFGNAAAEHAAIRGGVGLYDMSSFGKLRIEGPDAEAFLDHVCGADMSVPVGRIVYTQMLNARGGIEADVTVTRLSETAWLMVTPAATRLADETWLRRHLGGRMAVITDVTAGEAVLAVMGPKARELMQAVSPDDFGPEAHPFGMARQIEIGMGLARAHRVSYVGELGWELYVSADMAGHVFETLMEAGADHGLRLCGLHAMDSCRIEKGFRHFGHDITCEDHVLEAGLGFAVSKTKPDFIGRDAVQRKRNGGLQRRMVQFLLDDPEPLLFHNEPILRDGAMWAISAPAITATTSGRPWASATCPARGKARRASGVALRDRRGRDARAGQGQPQAALRPKSERMRA